MKNAPSSRIAFYVLFGCLILVMGRFLIGNAPAGRDLVLNYLPSQKLVRDSVRMGELPTWNPNTFCGRPLMADIQVGFFYPPNWLHWILPLPLSFTLLLLAHAIAALWGCFRLARAWNLSPQAACLLAVLYAFSGFLSVKLQSGVILFQYVATWLPWAALALTALVRQPSAIRVALLALALAMSLLAGSPQMTFFCWLMLAGLALILILNKAWHDRHNGDDESPQKKSLAFRALVPLALVAAAFVLALALTSIQTFQTREMTRVSFNRDANADPAHKWNFISEGSLHPRLLLMMLNPGYFGPGHDDLLYSGTDTGFTEACNYLPIACWLLIIPAGLLAQFSTRKKGAVDPLEASTPAAEADPFLRVFFYAALAWSTFSLLMAFGKYSPLFGFFYEHVPGFGLFRVPARWMFCCGVGLSIAAAVSYDRLLNAPPLDLKKPNAPTIWIIVAALLGGCVLWIISFRFEQAYGWFGFYTSGAFQGSPTFAKRGSDGYPIFPEDYVAHLLSRSIWGILFLVLAAALLIHHFYLKSRPTQQPQWLAQALPWAMPVLFAAELALLAWPNQLMTPIGKYYSTWYPQTELVQELKKHSTGGRILWTDDLLDWRRDQNTPEVVTNALIMQGRADARGYDPINAKWIGTWFNRLAGLPPETNPGGYMRVPRIALTPWLTVMGVEIVLSYQDLSQLPKMNLLDTISFPEGPLGVWENLNYRGRAIAMPTGLVEHFYQGTREEGQVFSEKAAIEKPDDPLNSIFFMETPSDSSLSPSIGGQRKVPQHYDLKAIREGPNRYTYETDFSGSGYLCLAQSAYPGWKVMIDGKPSRLIYIASGTFIATIVNHGRHTAEFEYSPPYGSIMKRDQLRAESATPAGESHLLGYETAQALSLITLVGILATLILPVRRFISRKR